MTDTPNKELTDKIIAAIRTVIDPEIPVNVYDMGLIYDIRIGENKDVNIDMTLTTPACPVAGILPLQVETKVKVLEGVESCKVDIVWDPPWTPDRMSDAAKLQLNMDVEPPRPRNMVDLRTPKRHH